MSETWSMQVKRNRVVILLGPDKPSTTEIELRLYGGEDADRDAETMAQARLIVAAPKLRAALERFVKNGVCTCVDGGPGFQCDVCEGAAALLQVVKPSRAELIEFHENSEPPPGAFDMT